MKHARARLWCAAFAGLASLMCLACHRETSDLHLASDASTTQLDRPLFCERDGADPIRDVFCAEEPPAITGLEDLQELFGVDPRDFDPSKPSGAFNLDPSTHVALLGHSTALSGRSVSPLNPRMIVLGGNTSMAFQRGVQQVELVTRSRDSGDLVFYLLTFEQACSASPSGCSPGDLYTPKVESNWTRFKVADDEELKNTPSDCRQCHRRGVESSRLLMRELESPWTHFFFSVDLVTPLPGENGSALMRDYLEAKGDELYGGVDMQLISALAVFNLQAVVGAEQPLLFDSGKIDSERWPWTPETGYATDVHTSPTWEGAYQAFKRGEQLALPYIELRATDPDKQAALASAYQDYRAGELDADELPDLGDIFPDDPRLRARIGLATEPDASPEEALIQACGSCHNDVLDQSISRARFTIALARLSRAEIDLAIDRIERPHNVPGAMPPPEARQLAPEARQRLLEYLRGDLDQDEIDPMLERAAGLGMTGGGNIGEAGGIF